MTVMQHELAHVRSDLQHSVSQSVVGLRCPFYKRFQINEVCDMQVSFKYSLQNQQEVVPPA